MSIATQEAHGFQLEQPVEVNRGQLAGISGVLIGFRGEHHCLIELNVGVLIVIDALAVQPFGLRPFDSAATRRV
jgi:hypothetical protein